MKLLTTYHSHNESFKIAKYEGKVVAINTKYIDSNGKITKQLRGFEMFVSEDVPTCLDKIEAEFRKQEFESQGYGEFAAIALAHGSSIEEALQIEQNMKDLINKTV